MTEIATRLLQEVQRRQIISFSRFMELALYCPDFGYYEQSERRIGSAGGDFFTSVSIGPLFGQLLAWHFPLWAGPGSFQLVETGAHGGQLACDILAWLSTTRPDLFQRITYCLI